jgi:hypothetical protein
VISSCSESEWSDSLFEDAEAESESAWSWEFSPEWSDSKEESFSETVEPEEDWETSCGIGGDCGLPKFVEVS